VSSLRAFAVATLAVIVVISGTIAEARAGEPEAEAAAAVVLDSLVIRVYDNAGVSAAERARGISRADAILSRADVDVEWVECGARTRGRTSPLCDTPVAGGELVVRLLNAPVSSRVGPLRHALGYSLIDSTTSTGTIATVFTDRVIRLAKDTRLDVGTLLGRAMAHEIGHLILGSNEHSEAGIMRDTWTAQQITSNKPQDWLFLPRQSDRLREARLLNGGGTTATMRKRGTSTGG
jgi:hypothetical protein